MTLAPSTGYETGASVFDFVAIPGTWSGTCASQPSSCSSSSFRSSVYQVPAWVASRLMVMSGGVDVLEKGRIGGGEVCTTEGQLLWIPN